jgi:hypothetical protein
MAQETAMNNQETQQPESPLSCHDLRGPVTPHKELEAQLEKWKRRALAFQEGYKDKSFEVTALEIQLMDLRAHGADKVTARVNESLRTKLLAACIERNEAKEQNKALREALNALKRDSKCWCQTWVGGEHEPECEQAQAALNPQDGD